LGAVSLQHFVDTTKANGTGTSLSHSSVSRLEVPDMQVTDRQTLLACMDDWVHQEPR